MSDGIDIVQKYFARTSNATLIRESERVSKYQPDTRFTVMAFIGIVLCVNSYDKMVHENDFNRDELLKIIDTELRERTL